MKQEQLLQILGTKPDEAFCQRVLAQLDEYITAQVAAEDYAVLFPDVAFHLDACPECAEAYGRLYNLALADETNTLPLPQQQPVPDLSFLPVVPTLADCLRTAIHRTQEAVSLYFSADLLPLLRPQPALAGLRGVEGNGRYGEQLLALEADETLYLPFGLAAYRDAQEPEKCLVEITIEPTGRSWPDLAGTMVTVATPTAQQQAITDEWGWVSFTGVATNELDQMVVRVAV